LILGFPERRPNTVIAVIGGPVKVSAAVSIGDRILRLIPANVDEREGLVHGNLKSHLPRGSVLRAFRVFVP